jgi:hypothetical protein
LTIATSGTASRTAGATARLATTGLSGLAARTATLGGLEALLGVELLFRGGEGELGAAIGTRELLLGVH